MDLLLLECRVEEVHSHGISLANPCRVPFCTGDGSGVSLLGSDVHPLLLSTSPWVCVSYQENRLSEAVLTLVLNAFTTWLIYNLSFSCSVFDKF